MEGAIVAEYHSIVASLANRCLTRAYPGAAVQGIVPAIKEDFGQASSPRQLIYHSCSEILK